MCLGSIRNKKNKYGSLYNHILPLPTIYQPSSYRKVDVVKGWKIICDPLRNQNIFIFIFKHVDKQGYPISIENCVHEELQNCFESTRVNCFSPVMFIYKLSLKKDIKISTKCLCLETEKGSSITCLFWFAVLIGMHKPDIYQTLFTENIFTS